MENEEIEITQFSIDCADFFAASLQRKFPQLEFNLAASKPWRLCWEITVPIGTHIRMVDDTAFMLMEKIFTDHGELVTYTLTVADGT